MSLNTYIPWVEKYRPTTFNDIVLDKTNKIIFTNILKTNYIPNLLLYGPPGTGKTTTITNLIHKYQENTNQCNKGLMIHLNASDERGIDIIRNQINIFVNSKSLFDTGIKFIILDEVDYMTKNAQLALKYLLGEYKQNIRFCLICNYISKIDDSLKSEFVKLRFNQLPKSNIINFLNIINKNENLKLTIKQIESIQNNFKSDIRSMINYMQSNQLAIINTKIINNTIFKNLSSFIYKKSYKNFYKELQNLSITYNIDIKNIIKDYFYYIIRYDSDSITPQFLNIIENIIHNSDINIDHQINYLFYSLQSIKS